MENKTKRLVLLAMLTAMAFVVGLYRIRFMGAATFLEYDAKDVIIVIGGFMFGPLAALMMSFVLALIEMLTHSEAGLWGMLMNFIASAALACPAAIIYHRFRSIRGAVVGLLVGIVAATSSMLLWNYLVVPFYTGWPREAVVGMLVPVFLPFNLIKATLNSALVMVLYKPITKALKSAKLYNPTHASSSAGKLNVAILLAAAFVVISLALFIFIRRIPNPTQEYYENQEYTLRRTACILWNLDNN